MFWNLFRKKKIDGMLLYSVAGPDGKPENQSNMPETGADWKEWLPALLSAVAIVACIVIFWAVRTFPLEVTVSTSSGNTSAESDLTVSVQTNQKIKEVRYYFNVPSGTDISAYKQAELSGEKKDKSFVIPLDELPTGVSYLSVYVRTAFGAATETVPVVGNLGFILAPDTASFISIDDYSDLISNELLLYFVPEATEEEIEKLLERYNGTVVGQNNLVGEYTVRFTGKGEEYINNLQEQLEQEPLIDSVFFNISHDYEQQAIPNDSEYNSWDVDLPDGNNWGLELINAPGAWEYATQLNTVKVGVMDSFLEFNHEDLQIDPSHTRIMATNDFTSMEELNKFYAETSSSHSHKGDDCDYCSMRDHGTHCSGIIGAKSNNKKGIAGVAWNSDLYFASFWYINKKGNKDELKVSSATNSLTFNLSYLVASGCRVVNISLGSSVATKQTAYEKNEANQFNKFVERLEESGYDFLFCKAAGNDNANASDYQMNRIMTMGDAARRHTIIVGAVEQTTFSKKDTEKIYNMASYSDYGELLDVTAPGSKIYSTVQGNTYRNLSGTSMATPVVTGVCALVYGTNEGMTYDKVKEIVCGSALNYCAKKGVTYKIVNAQKALEMAYDSTLLQKVEMPELGYVTGNVQDADSLKLIGRAKVLITNEATGETYETNTTAGMYELSLPYGTYKMEFSASKYLTDTIYHVEVKSDVVKYNALLNLVPTGDEKGTAEGKIIDGVTGKAIAGASLSFKKGVGNQDGAEELAASSDSKGKYSVSLAPGNYTMVVRATGYAGAYATVTVVSGKTRANQDCTLNPSDDSEIRIILTWSNAPKDLDAHLEGPTPDGGNFHIFYQNKEYVSGGESYDKLDVDAREGLGPETITISHQVQGTYTFSVYDYSNRKQKQSAALSVSGAKVTVYTGADSEPLIFNVPTDAGTKWTVFTMQNGTVTPVNTMEYYDAGQVYYED